MYYDNAQQFIDDCSMGLDIEFAFGDYQYTVLGWYPGGPMIGRQHPHDDIQQQFGSPDALLDGFQIDGQPLRNIINQIELLLH